MSAAGGGEAAFSGQDRHWMRLALRRARDAEAAGEVPVGAVVICAGELVGEGRNRNITLGDPSAHAEIVALRAAGRRLGNHRMPGCTLYVTLEPCAMCVGAALHSRLDAVVFGARDPKTGALGGAFDLTQIHTHNHRLNVQGGLMAEECGDLLKSFFQNRRKAAMP